MAVVRAEFSGFSPKCVRVGSRSRAVGNVKREERKEQSNSHLRVWGRGLTSTSVAELYGRLDCPLGVWS